jgi:Leucine-rich repeat (LRR) protein
MIEKITGISSLKNLKILSLGRNYIKNFSGLVTIPFCYCSLICFTNIEKFKSPNNRLLQFHIPHFSCEYYRDIKISVNC